MKYILFDCCLNPTDKDSKKVTWKLKVFEDCMPQEYCKWRINYSNLVLYPLFNKAKAK